MPNALDEKLDALMDFVRENMSTKQDINSINDRLDRQEGILNDLTIALDNLAKLTHNY